MNHLDDYTLNEYLDRALDESARAEVEAHLDTCAACNAKLDELRKLFAELGDLPEVNFEGDLAPAIFERLPRHEPIRPWVWTRSLAAQLGVVVGFVFWLGMQVTSFVSVPQFAWPKVSTIELRSLFMQLLTIQFSISKFCFPDLVYRIPTLNIQMPSFNPPALFKASFQVSTVHIVVLAISTIILWVVGNVILLKSGQER
jgi:hypothetical protein